MAVEGMNEVDGVAYLLRDAMALDQFSELVYEFRPAAPADLPNADWKALDVLGELSS